MRRFAPRALTGMIPALVPAGSTTMPRSQVVPRRSSVLLELTQSLNRARTPDEVVRALIDGACRGLGAHRASVLVGPTGRPEAHRCADDDSGAATVAAPLRTVLPLTVADDVVGLLTLTWEQPRALDSEDQAMLCAVAASGATALQRALLAERHRDEMTVLRDALLPNPDFDVPGVDVAVRDLPLGATPVVGGDWYDCFPLPRGHVGLVVGDVAGHGLPAARAMGAMRHACKALALVLPDPAQVVGAMNTLLRRETGQQIASMVFVDLDPSTGEARVAIAGHLPPLLVRTNGENSFLEQRGGPLLGVLDAAAYPVVRHHLPDDGALVLYTDGLVERRNAAIDDGLASLADTATRHWTYGATSAELAEALFTHRPTLRDATDDVSVLVARRVRPPAAG